MKTQPTRIPTPRTDALEQSIPESAILCEHFYDMQALAHKIEEDLATARHALESIKIHGAGPSAFGYWNGKECGHAANLAIHKIADPFSLNNPNNAMHLDE